MNKEWLKIFVGFVVVVPLSLMVIVPVVTWAQNPSGQSYTLQAKYKAGDINRYQTSMLTQTALPNVGTTTMNISMTQEQKIERVLPDGSAEIAVTTLNSRGTMNDKPIAMETDRNALKMVLDKRGNVKSLSNLPKAAQGLSGMFGGNSQLSGAYLPTKPVKVGESWTSTVAMPSTGGIKTTATVKSTFLRLEQIGRFHTARLRTQMTAPIAIMTDGQGQITQKRRQSLCQNGGENRHEL